MKEKVLRVLCVLIISTLSISTVSADSIAQPGQVGYASQAYNKLPKQERDKFVRILKCGISAGILGMDDISGDLFGRLMSEYDIPLWWKNYETEIVSFYRGYMTSLHNMNPDLAKKAFFEICPQLHK